MSEAANVSNTNRIRGKFVDDTAIGDGKVLSYNASQGQIVYTAVATTIGSISGLQPALDSKLSINNNLSDLNDVGSARSNLQLGSAALSNASDFDPAGAAAAVAASIVIPSLDNVLSIGNSSNNGILISYLGVGSLTPTESTVEIGTATGNFWSSHLRFTRTGTSADIRIAAASDGLLFRNFDSTASKMYSFRDYNDTHIWDLLAGGRSLFNGATDDSTSVIQVNGDVSLQNNGTLKMNNGMIDSVGTVNLSYLNVNGGSISLNGAPLLLDGSSSIESDNNGNITFTAINLSFITPIYTAGHNIYMNNGSGVGGGQIMLEGGDIYGSVFASGLTGGNIWMGDGSNTGLGGMIQMEGGWIYFDSSGNSFIGYEEGEIGIFGDNGVYIGAENGGVYINSNIYLDTSYFNANYLYLDDNGANIKADGSGNVAAVGSWTFATGATFSGDTYFSGHDLHDIGNLYAYEGTSIDVIGGFAQFDGNWFLNSNGTATFISLIVSGTTSLDNGTITTDGSGNITVNGNLTSGALTADSLYSNGGGPLNFSGSLIGINGSPLFFDNYTYIVGNNDGSASFNGSLDLSAGATFSGPTTINDPSATGTVFSVGADVSTGTTNIYTFYGPQDVGSVNADLGSGNAKVATQYTLYQRSFSLPYATAWTFSGSNDGTNFTVLDNKSGQTYAYPQNYTIVNSVAYRYYRWSVTAGTGNGQEAFLDQFVILSDYSFVHEPYRLAVNYLTGRAGSGTANPTAQWSVVGSNTANLIDAGNTAGSPLFVVDGSGNLSTSGLISAGNLSSSGYMNCSSGYFGSLGFYGTSGNGLISGNQLAFAWASEAVISNSNALTIAAYNNGNLTLRAPGGSVNVIDFLAGSNGAFTGLFAAGNISSVGYVNASTATFTGPVTINDPSATGTAFSVGADISSSSTTQVGSYPTGGQVVGTLNQSFVIDLGAGNASAVTKYSLQGLFPGPTGWTFAASNDNSTYATLDVESGQSSGPSLSFLVSNSTAYRYYRLTVTTADQSSYFLNSFTISASSSASTHRSYAIAVNKNNGRAGSGTATPTAQWSVVGPNTANLIDAGNTAGLPLFIVDGSGNISAGAASFSGNANLNNHDLNSVGNLFVNYSAAVQQNLTVYGYVNTAGGYEVGGNTVIDGSRNLTVASGTFAGNVSLGVYNLSSAGLINVSSGAFNDPSATGTVLSVGANVNTGLTTFGTYNGTNNGNVVTPVASFVLDAGSAAVVNEYSVTSYNALRVTAFSLYGSNDNSTFTLLDTESNATFPGNNPSYYSFANTVAYRYYKITITATSNGSQAFFYGFSVYSSTAKTYQTGRLAVNSNTGWVGIGTPNPTGMAQINNLSAATFGNVYGLAITPTWNQSGTASSIDLYVNRTNNSIGSGVNRLMDLGVNGTSMVTIDLAGNFGALNSSSYVNGSTGSFGTLSASTYSGNFSGGYFNGSSASISTAKINDAASTASTVFSVGADVASGYTQLGSSGSAGPTNGTGPVIDTGSSNTSPVTRIYAATSGFYISISWTLSASNDGTNYTTIGTFTPSLGPYYNFANSTVYRYWKLVGTTGTGLNGNFYDLDGFKVYCIAATAHQPNALCVNSLSGQVGAGTGIPLGQLHVVKISTDISGSIYGLLVTATYNQSGGTANNTTFCLNHIPASIGSGNQRIFDFQNNGTSQFYGDTSGNLFHTGYSSAAGVISSTYVNGSTGSFSTTLYSADYTGITETIGVSVDNSGYVINTGTLGFRPIDHNYQIVGYQIIADQSGSIVFSIGTCTFANYPTTTSIVASAPPTISSAVSAQSTTLTGWTTTLAAGGFLQFGVTSVTTITKATLVLQVKRV